jgi:hypothetical protein
MEENLTGSRYENHFAKVVIVVLMLLVIGSYSWLRTNLPGLAEWLPTLLTVVGGSCLVVTAMFYGRYSQVFDHEPTVFLGRPSTGQEARLVLGNIGFAGLCMILLAMGLVYWECILSQACTSPFDRKFEYVD